MPSAYERRKRRERFNERYGWVWVPPLLAAGWGYLHLTGESPMSFSWNPFGLVGELFLSVEGVFLLTFTLLFVWGMVAIPYGTFVSVRERVRDWRWGGAPETIGDPDDEYWSPTPIIAWRAWSFFDGQLHGMWRTWTSSTMEAECHQGCGDEAPGVGCTCGIYAFRHPADAYNRGKGLDVIGKVELTGLVVEHERGYRAQHVRIVELRVREPDVHRRVASAYPDVAVVLARTRHRRLTP